MPGPRPRRAQAMRPAPSRCRARGRASWFTTRSISLVCGRASKRTTRTTRTRGGTCSCPPKRARVWTCCSGRSLCKPARTRTWKARSSHASAISSHCAMPRRGSQRHRITSTLRRRRSRSSPRTCAARRRRSGRLPANSAQTICWARSFRDFASANEMSAAGPPQGDRPRSSFARAQWLQGSAGLAAGAAGGWIWSPAHTPIPWMLGPLVTLAFLRVAGVRIGSPPGGRQIGQWIIGTSLGLYFTPHVIREVAGWWWLLAIGAVFAIGLGYGGGVLLARLAGIDRTTGIFASVPGGAAEMSVLGERFGARAARDAAAQSLRILIVVLVVPAVYAFIGVHGADPYVPGTTAFSAKGL